jgi:exopolysaccharide biosynthesis polyprenyl glycosylphosphotransferase
MAELFADVVTIIIAVTAAYVSYLDLHIGKEVRYSGFTVVEGSALIAVLFVAVLALDGGYQLGNSLLRIRETERILRASLRSFVIVLSVSFFAAQMISRAALLFAVVLVPISLVIEKQLLHACLSALHSRGYGVRKVIIYGAGATGRRLFSVLVRSHKLGMNPIAIVDDDCSLAGSEVNEYGYRHTRSVKVIAGPLTERMILRHDADLIVVAIPSLPDEKLNRIVEISMAAGTAVAFAPRLSNNSDLVANYVDIDGVLISSLQLRAQTTVYDTAKRIFDVAASLFLLAVSAPFLLLIALLIRLDSSGPALFRQFRIGKGGIPFRIYKFRTMHVDAARYSLHPKKEDDPRITRVGKWLRRTSLDEFPQLMNVLSGEMSLVGPRPEMPFIVEQYEDRHWQRLQVKPGVTGLWQLSADRAFPIHKNIHYDLYYIRNRNFFMDIAILLHTLVFAAKGV